jgi:hypothetical protein
LGFEAAALDKISALPQQLASLGDEIGDVRSVEDRVGDGCLSIDFGAQ